MTPSFVIPTNRLYIIPKAGASPPPSDPLSNLLLPYNGDLVDAKSRHTLTKTGTGAEAYDAVIKPFGSYSAKLHAATFSGWSESAPSNISDFTMHGEPWTWDCWVRFNDWKAGCSFTWRVYKNPSVNECMVYIYPEATEDKMRVRTYTSGGVAVVTEVTPLSLVIDTWYHFAVTYDGSKLYFFLNGTLLNVGGTAHDMSDVSPGGISLGFHRLTWTCLAGGVSGTRLCYTKEFRFIRNNCVWTANFTPPSAEYNN